MVSSKTGVRKAATHIKTSVIGIKLKSQEKMSAKPNIDDGMFENKKNIQIEFNKMITYVEL